MRTSAMQRADVIVVGSGGIGSAAACHLSRRGARVLALDRFPVAHDHGSSHGQTRLIRLAYYEHPDYVPLLRRGYALWRELEAATDRRLLVENGLLMAGPPDGEVVTGALRSAATHGVTVDRMTAEEAVRRFPAFTLPEDWSAIHEACGGFLLVEECVRAHADEAMRAGAQFRSDVTVVGWRADGGRVVVETDQGELTADRLVLAPGPWAGDLLRLPSMKLTVLRKSLFWFRPDRQSADAFSPQRFPCFAFDAPHGFFYGFPAVDGRGVKMAEHSGGRIVADPLSVDRAPDAMERCRLECEITAQLPSLGHDVSDHAVCLYTMSPDRHFIVGLHPEHPHVAIAAGFSGHGFKFASVMGEVLADLAIDGRTSHPIGFLSPDRTVPSC